MVLHIQHTNSFSPTDRNKPKNHSTFFSPQSLSTHRSTGFPLLMIKVHQGCCHRGCWPQPFQNFWRNAYSYQGLHSSGENHTASQGWREQAVFGLAGLSTTQECLSPPLSLGGLAPTQGMVLLEHEQFHALGALISSQHLLYQLLLGCTCALVSWACQSNNPLDISSVCCTFYGFMAYSSVTSLRACTSGGLTLRGKSCCWITAAINPAQPRVLLIPLHTEPSPGLTDSPGKALALGIFFFILLSCFSDQVSWSVTKLSI